MVSSAWSSVDRCFSARRSVVGWAVAMGGPTPRRAGQGDTYGVRVTERSVGTRGSVDPVENPSGRITPMSADVTVRGSDDVTAKEPAAGEQDRVAAVGTEGAGAVGPVGRHRVVAVVGTGTMGQGI